MRMHDRPIAKDVGDLLCLDLQKCKGIRAATGDMTLPPVRTRVQGTPLPAQEREADLGRREGTWEGGTG
jgi:hypothetical protein